MSHQRPNLFAGAASRAPLQGLAPIASMAMAANAQRDSKPSNPFGATSPLAASNPANPTTAASSKLPPMPSALPPLQGAKTAPRHPSSGASSANARDAGFGRGQKCQGAEHRAQAAAGASATDEDGWPPMVSEIERIREQVVGARSPLGRAALSGFGAGRGVVRGRALRVRESSQYATAAAPSHSGRAVDDSMMAPRAGKYGPTMYEVRYGRQEQQQLNGGVQYSAQEYNRPNSRTLTATTTTTMAAVATATASAATDAGMPCIVSGRNLATAAASGTTANSGGDSGVRETVTFGSDEMGSRRRRHHRRDHDRDRGDAGGGNQAGDDRQANAAFEALFSKARHGRYEEVKELFDQGVSVDARDGFGNTLLMVASQNGLKRLAKICLRRGADMNCRNHNGMTALMFAFMFGYHTLGTYLIGKGADATIRNNEGQTCFDLNNQRSAVPLVGDERNDEGGRRKKKTRGRHKSKHHKSSKSNRHRQ